MKFIYTVFQSATDGGTFIDPVGSFDNERDALFIAGALGPNAIGKPMSRICKTKVIPDFDTALKEIERRDKARRKRLGVLD